MAQKSSLRLLEYRAGILTTQSRRAYMLGSHTYIHTYIVLIFPLQQTLVQLEGYVLAVVYSTLKFQMSNQRYCKFAAVKIRTCPK